MRLDPTPAVAGVTIQRVTGQKCPIIKLLREIGGEDGRGRNNLFFAEGEELVRRAFDYGATLHSIVINERYTIDDALLAPASTAKIPIYSASDGLLAKVLEAKPVPECLAIVERRIARLADVLAGDFPLVQMVEHCESADNLGMLLRSTDAAGVTGVVLTSDTTDPFSRRVVRGSRGAIFSVPICIHNDSAHAIEEAKAKGLTVIATSSRADVIYTDLDYTKPAMIVVGNEHVGISDTVREHADAVVRIPMFGKINSLNIAVAASLMMYEAVRQR